MNPNFGTVSFSELWELVRSAPTFFGAALTGLIAIAVLFITNFWSDRRLRRQLENDKELKRYDANQKLRQELYLNATAGLYSVLDTVIKITHAETSATDTFKDHDVQSANIAKIQLVAPEKILLAIAEFTTALHNTHLQLSIARNQLIKKKIQVDGIRNDAKRYRDEYTDLIKRKKELLLQEVSNPKTLVVLDHFLKFAKDGSDQRHEDCYRAEVKWYEENLQFKEHCSREEANLSRLLLQITIKIREELGLTKICEKRFAEIFDEGVEKRNENLKKAFNEVKTLINEQADRQEEAELTYANSL